MKLHIKKHSDCILGYDNEFCQLYDCVDEAIGEDLDCWYCDECKGLVVFVDLSRYDFQRMKLVPDVEITDFPDWEDYIALRDQPFEDFEAHCEGKNPLVAIETYNFDYKYKVSTDKKTIYAFGKDGKVAYGYRRCGYAEFSPDLEITFPAGDPPLSYTPFKDYKGRLDLVPKPGMYAYLKDGRTVIIDAVIDQGSRYNGRDINIEGLPSLEFLHADILKIADAIL